MHNVLWCEYTASPGFITVHTALFVWLSMILYPSTESICVNISGKRTNELQNPEYELLWIRLYDQHQVKTLKSFRLNISSDPLITLCSQPLRLTFCGCPLLPPLYTLHDWRHVNHVSLGQKQNPACFSSHSNLYDCTNKQISPEDFFTSKFRSFHSEMTSEDMKICSFPPSTSASL